MKRSNVSFNKIAYNDLDLKGVCKDEKIILWLLTHPTEKVKMALRLQNNVHAAFTVH
jgi:hypothetical protein